jgi:hypothetical protein
MKISMKHWWKYADREKQNVYNKVPTWSGSGQNTGDSDGKQTTKPHCICIQFYSYLLRRELAPLEESFGECCIMNLWLLIVTIIRNTYTYCVMLIAFNGVQ